jgi:hypothetical protein
MPNENIELKRRLCFAGIIICLQTVSSIAISEEPAGGMSKEEAARAAQNPLASAVSVPLQDNVNFRLGDTKRASNWLNIQPVLPIPVKKLLIINRFIFPLVYQPDAAVADDGTPGYAKSGGEFGTGDLTYSMFFAPAKQGKVIGGAGPIFSFPTASVDSLKTKKFGIGPAACLLAMPGKFVLGLIVQNIWSVAGASDGTDVNSMLIQYFINYNLPLGFYLTTSPIITANWEQPNDQRWVVPVGGGFGKIFKIGKAPINTQIQAYYNAVTPDLGSSWGMRFQVQFFLPSPFDRKKATAAPDETTTPATEVTEPAAESAGPAAGGETEGETPS